MLYDKRWDKQVETKADPLTPENLMAWLKAQPEAQTYVPGDPGNCLLGQWCRAMGEKDFFWRSYLLGQEKPFSAIALPGSGRAEDYTFGAALKRAGQIA